MPDQILTAGLTTIEGAAAPEWIELIPIGEVRLNDGRGPFRLDDPEGVIARSFKAGEPLQLDIDHGPQRLGRGGTSAAAGWIVEIQARDGSLWGRVEWTSLGREMVEGRVYRRISPTFAVDAKGQVRALVGAALVNNPAIPALAPVAASEEREMDLTEIAAALGLSAEADAAAIAAAARAAVAERDRAVAAAKLPDPAAYAPVAAMTALQAEVAELRAAAAKREAEELVAAARRDGKLAPAQIEWASAYAARDAAGFRAWAAAAPVIVGAKPLTAQPTAKPAGELGELDLEICAGLGLSPEAFAKTAATIVLGAGHGAD